MTTQVKVPWGWLCVLIAILMLGAIVAMVYGYDNLAYMLVMLIALILGQVFGFTISQTKTPPTTPEARFNVGATKYIATISLLCVGFFTWLAVSSFVDGAIPIAIFALIAIFLSVYTLLKATVVKP